MSLLAKALLLVIILLVVPVILYDQFRSADQQKRELVLASVRDQGRIVALALSPLLTAEGQPNLPAVGETLARFRNEATSIKLLFRPSSGAQGFYYVGSSEPISNAALDAERDRLKEQGVLDRLEESCSGAVPIALHYTAPDGRDQVVLSLNPIRSANGCWAIVTTLSAGALPGAALNVPYYDTPEIKVAGIIYLVMAVVTLTTFWSIWRGLLQFGERARAIRSQTTPAPSFVAQNDVPELAGVAEEFDRMVETLGSLAKDLRLAAEDNAHAFKTPVAIIRQSLEPVSRAIPGDNTRAQRALGLIEQSLDKLDGLVASARRLDQAAADLLDTPRVDVDLSELTKRVLSAHSELFRQRGLTARLTVDNGVTIRGNEEMVETVIENVLENAVSFSRPGAAISVTLRASGDAAELSILDEGPGVRDADLPRIFDRYFSSRANAPGTGERSVHFGVGLWIVKRNVEALGGQVSAENHRPNGLLMRISLPLKRSRDHGSEPARRAQAAGR